MYIRKFIYTTIGITLISSTLLAQKSQSDQQWSENGRFGIGVGYNFRNVPRSTKAMRPMEFSLKYSINKRHSIYITIPYYYEENRGKRESLIPAYVGINKKQRLCGVGIGYNYHFLHQKNFSEFCGIGFNYFHTKNITEHSWNNNDAYRITHNKQHMYAISPQFGADYRYQHFTMELKYIYYLSKRKTKSISEIEGLYQTEYTTYNKDNVLLKGLSLSLFYYF